MYHPSLEEFRRLASPGDSIPILREVAADLETPVSAYLKIARGGYSFLLESVEGGERLARYSFLGTEPHLVLRGDAAQGDPLLALERELKRYRPLRLPGLPRFHGGAVGYLAYEVARHFERLPSPDRDPLGLPESIFLFTDTLLAFDHVKHRIKVISHAHLDGAPDAAYAAAVERIETLVDRLSQPAPAEPSNETVRPHLGAPWAPSNMNRQAYLDTVVKAKEYIAAGDIIQAVLSQRFSQPTRAHPFAIYRALRSLNPSPYMFYLHLDDFYLIGASPELLVRLEDGLIDYHPIAGTRPRGRDAQEDTALEQELRHDEKERAEHVMLLDLGRNDVGRVSLPGSVRVTQLMEVERYSHVMHLVSHIQGRLRPELSPLEALRSCFPAGTVTGAPKIRAMEIIAELEPERRGPYAGAVGYLDYSGNLDTAITIRTIVLKDGVAHVQAGGGIVADSDPEREFMETVHKAQALLHAIEEAEFAAAHRQLR